MGSVVRTRSGGECQLDADERRVKERRSDGPAIGETCEESPPCRSCSASWREVLYGVTDSKAEGAVSLRLLASGTVRFVNVPELKQRVPSKHRCEEEAVRF